MKKKTSLYLDDSIDELLAQRAAEEGVTKAEYIRRVLASAVNRPRRLKPKAIGLVDNGPSDLSSRLDDYLDGFGQ